jgi:uncharacterized repeat protein (TIGR01451 family)
MPGLSIDVNDGRTAVKPGDLLRYVVEVHNIGTTTARHLLLTQTLPPGMRLISASRHGAARAGRVSWWVSLPVGHSGTFRVVGRAGRTPAHLLRLATVACAAADGSIKPVVCAAHSDRLPAGALAAALKPGTAAAGNQTTRRYVTVVVAALVLAALTLIVPRRLALRRRARRLG